MKPDSCTGIRYDRQTEAQENHESANLQVQRNCRQHHRTTVEAFNGHPATMYAQPIGTLTAKAAKECKENMVTGISVHPMAATLVPCLQIVETRMTNFGQAIYR